MKSLENHSRSKSRILGKWIFQPSTVSLSFVGTDASFSFPSRLKFIIENWIAPSIFLAPDLTEYFIPDEWNYIQVVSNVTSREDAEERLKNHFDTWITESDFRLIAASGLNTVRLPIPFWTFNTSTTIPYLEPYLSNIQKPYIKKALKWAIKYKLDVVLDLHSAPGSQNGDEHSGHQGFIGEFW